jgi:hypothetical protein
VVLNRVVLAIHTVEVLPSVMVGVQYVLDIRIVPMQVRGRLTMAADLLALLVGDYSAVTSLVTSLLQIPRSAGATYASPTYSAFRAAL